MLQILCDFYLPYAFGSENLEDTRADSQNDMGTCDVRAVLLLKKIELSRGYEAYRKERMMAGVAKPPIVLAKDSFNESN